MVREYKWRLRVRSYEGDAWGFVPTTGILRYLEHSAVAAADDVGYGSEFHREHGSAWIIRRMTLLMHAPARQGDDVDIVTWISHFARVRGGREYRVLNADTSELLYTGLAEWVYVDRQTLAPIAIPAGLDVEFDTPGAPLGQYDPPAIEPILTPREFTIERTVEWHEIDTMGHVNNAIYADWLDDALKAALKEMGGSATRLQQEGAHLRGEYYNLNYKRAAMPGEGVRIVTTIKGHSGRLLAVGHSVTNAEGTELLTANSVQGWRDNTGEPATTLQHES